MTVPTQADRAVVRRLRKALRELLPIGQATTREYAAAMARGDAFPAIKCALRPDGSLEIRDGRLLAGRSLILVRHSTRPLVRPQDR